MRISVLAVLAILLCAVPVSAQAPAGVDPNLVTYAFRPTHGVGSYPDSLRLAVSSDTRLMDWYADLLMGRRTTEGRWSPATALWWLAQNGDPKYLPVFYEWAGREDNDLGDQDGVVALGLAWHSRDPVARQALLELVSNGTKGTRRSTVYALSTMNDSLSRALLMQMGERDLLAGTDSLVNELLAGPPQPQRPGRVGCLRSEKLGPDEAGVYGCHPRDP